MSEENSLAKFEEPIMDYDHETTMDDFLSMTSKEEITAITSFPRATQEDKEKISIAINGAQPLSNFIGLIIPVVGHVIMPTKITDSETKKQKEVLRLFLVDEDGNSYFSSAEGVITTYANILKSMGEPETWERPVCVYLFTQQTANKRTTNLLHQVAYEKYLEQEKGV